MQGVHGPFLVVVPLSTVPNWIREFRKWLPQLNSVVYVGDTKSREVRCREHMWLVGPATSMMCLEPYSIVAMRFDGHHFKRLGRRSANLAATLSYRSFGTSSLRRRMAACARTSSRR
jgi:SNF2-related domain